MHDPSVSQSRPRLGCFLGTFSPSRRQIRSTRLSLMSQPARRSHRSTQRKVPRGRDDEDLADIVELARQYGRYGYRKIAELRMTAERTLSPAIRDP